MKKRLIALIGGAVLAVSLSGCAHQVNAPLPANAVNAFDADANSVLQTAYGFVTPLNAAVQSTDPTVHIELTATQKDLLNKLNMSLNIAIPLEQAYHRVPTTANQQALQSALPSVKTALANAQAAVPVPPGK